MTHLQKSFIPKDTEIKEDVVNILKKYEIQRGNLISILQDVQSNLGYLPRYALTEVARFLGIPDSEVYSTATFYNQFRFIPPGRHQIKVCLGTACQIKGGSMILQSWERELQLKEGQTSDDREYSLERVACVGCCALAPVAVVDERVEGKVSPTRVKGILLGFDLQRKREHDKNSDKESGDAT